MYLKLKLIFITMLVAMHACAKKDLDSDAEVLVSKAKEPLKAMLTENLKRFKNDKEGLTIQELNLLKSFSEDFVASKGFEDTTIKKQTNSSPEKAKDHIAKIDKILKFEKKSYLEKARACKSFAELLAKENADYEVFEIKKTFGSDIIRMTSKTSAPDLSLFSNDDLEKMHTLFQYCKFQISRFSFGDCGLKCKGVQKLHTPIAITQKLDGGKYFGKYRTMTSRGMRLVDTNLLVESDVAIEKGDLFFIGIYAGSTKEKLTDGYSYSVGNYINLSLESSTAILCRFRQYIKESTKRVKSKCGWVRSSRDFFDTGHAGLGCALQSELNGDKLKKANQYYLDFDYPYCS